MKHRIELFCLIAAVIAAAALTFTTRRPEAPRVPLAVTGITVGMTQAQVAAAVGQPDMKSEAVWSYFDGNRMDPRLVVSFDDGGHVTRVLGRTLQQQDQALTARGDSRDKVTSALGSPQAQSSPTQYAYRTPDDKKLVVTFQGTQVADVILTN